MDGRRQVRTVISSPQRPPAALPDSPFSHRAHVYRPETGRVPHALVARSNCYISMVTCPGSPLSTPATCGVWCHPPWGKGWHKENRPK